MHVTLREIEGTDGDIWSLEQIDDELYLMHTLPDIGRRVSIPMEPVVLEMFAVAARNRPPRQTKVIPIRKFIPGNPASPRFA